MWAGLDAEFYQALSAGHEGCQGVVDELKCRGLFLLPTAYQEIADLAMFTTDQEIRDRALSALSLMPTHGVLAAPPPCHNVGTDDGLAEALLKSGLLAEDQKNSALILSEASCLGVTYLLTLDPALIGLNRKKLRETIETRDLENFEIVTVSHE
jgi:hypothetical protein